jgi:sugar O-acyltransferase (sialic acid O-acetyltransferase NeuD family)
MKKLIIFGTSSLAHQSYVFFSQDSAYEIAGFTVNEKYIDNKELFGLKVFPYEQIEHTHPPDDYAMFLAIGYKRVNKARAEVYTECKSKGYDLVSYVSSKIACWGHIEIGDNTFIYGGGNIQPFAKIGNDVISATAHIGHNAVIGDHVFIAGHAMIAGNTRIGNYSFIGANATISDGITIAPECVIGAGAVILKDTEKAGVYPGVASQIAHKKSHELKSFQ